MGRVRPRSSLLLSASPLAVPKAQHRDQTPHGRATVGPTRAPLAPFLLPATLLLAGALVGYPFSLNQAIASERLGGLLAATLLGVGVLVGVRRLPDRAVAPALVSIGLVSLVGAAWVVAAAGTEVFRGPLEAPLRRLAAPLAGTLAPRENVALTNTRFIVGYNGLADLCLVAVFASGAALSLRTGGRGAVLAWSVLLLAGLVLLNTGSRGGVAGLLAGLWAAALAIGRRARLAALVATPLALLAAGAGLIGQGLDASSVQGRAAFWTDWLRLLAEYPFTGVGLGVDTVYRVVVEHEVNPDPERIFYAHNTFVQTYLEQGPLGLLGALLLPSAVIAAAVLAGRDSRPAPRRALLAFGLALVAALEIHGLTDQVLTTNTGTALLFAAAGVVLGTLGPLATAWIDRGSRMVAAALAAVLVIVAGATAVFPAGRALALLNVGGLLLNRATLGEGAADRPAIAAAERLFQDARALAPQNAAILRGLARAQIARQDAFGALDTLERLKTLPTLDAFDGLQVAHLSRDLGDAAEALALAQDAYRALGRPMPNVVAQAYGRATLKDDPRVRTLADQADAAMRALRYGEAATLYRQALQFDPGSAYLSTQLANAERKAAATAPGGPGPPE